MREVTVTDLAADTGMPVIDVRERHEWDEAHVPHAVHIPMGEIPERYAEIPDGAAIICASGGRSGRVVQYLEQALGIVTHNVSGGTKAWIAEGLSVEKGAAEA